MPDLPRRRRPERPSWTGPIVQRLTPAIKALVIADALLFLVFVFAEPAQAWMKTYLAIWPDFLGALHLWQPVTALFVHFRLIDLIFDVVGLWWMGASLERMQGTRRFLALFFVAGILANVAAALVAHASGVRVSYEGCSWPVLAMFVAFGRLQGRQMTAVFSAALVLQARVVALVFVGLGVIVSIIQGVSTGDWGGLVGTLVAVAVGYLVAAPGGLRELYDSIRVRRLRRRYRVIEGGAPRRGRSSKYWN
jgi:membrane associated rhomboid family serine protease